MIKKTKYLIFFLLFFLLTCCSFKNVGGLWDGSEKEKQRIAELERKQGIEIVKIHSSENIYKIEILPSKSLVLTEPRKNSSWKMSGLNLQNSTGNLYLSGIDNNFLKKKIGKNKFKVFQGVTSPLVIEDNIILTDDTGTIYNIDLNGKINWKKNIYTKMYKKIYKNVTFSIYKNEIYVADNIGFIYSLSLKTGRLLWIKNHGVPLKSNIKVYDEKIFLINQDNRLICLDIKNGSKIWDIRSVTSFIKSQYLLSIALSKNGDLLTLNSTGDLSKIKSSNGRIYWQLNPTGSTFAHDTDFFRSSDIAISDNDIIFSASSSIFSINLERGYINWRHNINVKNTPIIDGNNVFLVSNNGYFINIDRKSGEIIWSINILKILKKKKRNTKVTSIIMGSGKIYVTTHNGYIIVCSASSGKVESFKKIGERVVTSPVIANGSLYLLTEKSRILGFN